MTTPSRVQGATSTGSAVTSLQVTLTAVAAGNLLVLLIDCNNTADRTFTVADDQGNTWSRAVRIRGATNTRICEIWLANNVAAGTTIITVTPSASATLRIFAEEVADIDDTVPLDQTGTNEEAAGVTAHYSAASGSIDTAADVICYSVGIHNASAGTLTQGTGWTQLYGTTPYHAQYRVSAGALTDERGAWTSGTARQSVGAIASFKGAAAGGGPFPHHARRQMTGGMIAMKG